MHGPCRPFEHTGAPSGAKHFADVREVTQRRSGVGDFVSVIGEGGGRDGAAERGARGRALAPRSAFLRGSHQP